MTIDYRDATVADAGLLAELGARTFTATFGHLYSPANLAAFLENHTTARWTAALAGTASARLAEAGGQPVGYARIDKLAVDLTDAETGGRPAAHLYQLYVDAGWHGRGVAQALMDWAIVAARARGAADLWLTVFTENHRARAFYRRYGFVEVKPFVFMVGDQADEDILCRLALD